MHKIYICALLFFSLTNEINAIPMQPMSIVRDNNSIIHPYKVVVEADESLLHSQNTTTKLTCRQKCFTTHTVKSMCSPRQEVRHTGGYCGTCIETSGVCLVAWPVLIPLFLCAGCIMIKNKTCPSESQNS